MKGDIFVSKFQQILEDCSLAKSCIPSLVFSMFVNQSKMVS